MLYIIVVINFLYFSSFLRTLPIEKFNGSVDDERSYLPTSIASRSPSNVPPSHRNSGRFLYVAEVEEIRVSSAVSRKGYLNCLDDKTKGWVKHWVVSISLLCFFVKPYSSNIDIHIHIKFLKTSRW